MRGLMMDNPLLISSIVEHADINFPDREIVSVMSDDLIHRYTYRDCFKRVRKLANALTSIGLSEGDRIATIAWNDYRHLEAYYAIGGAGYVCHTINPRLSAEQMVYIINHAEDSVICVDLTFVPILESLKDQIPAEMKFIIMTDQDHMPDTSLKHVLCYEELLEPCDSNIEWPEFPEETASSLCYTSGTTGNPKGVVYSHRSTVLHSLVGSLPDAMNLSGSDVIMPIVPMFHVNAWGTSYSAPLVGAKLVFPGPKMADGETLTKLINTEKVNYSLGVPTVWLALVEYLNASGNSVDSLKSVVVGGAACPLSLMHAMDKYGIYMHVGWGMTEMRPLGSYNNPMVWMKDGSYEAKHA